MTLDPPIVVSAAVEGDMDAAVARRLITFVGAQPGSIYGKQGKPALRQKITGFNNAATRSPWLVLVDLDQADACASQLIASWLPEPAARLCFRVAVRSIEAWLMADPDHLAEHLRIARGKIPSDPEQLADPKRRLVELARGSRNRDVRLDMVPRAGSGRSTGPAYASRMVEFIESRWAPATAARRADSLGRAIACLRRLAGRAS